MMATSQVNIIMVALLEGQIVLSFDADQYMMALDDAKELSCAIMRKVFDAKGVSEGTD